MYWGTLGERAESIQVWDSCDHMCTGVAEKWSKDGCLLQALFPVPSQNSSNLVYYCPAKLIMKWLRAVMFRNLNIILLWTVSSDGLNLISTSVYNVTVVMWFKCADLSYCVRVPHVDEQAWLLTDPAVPSCGSVQEGELVAFSRQRSGSSLFFFF